MMMTMKKRKVVSVRRKRTRKRFRPDYALQGTELDLPIETVLGFTPKQRRKYINDVLDALAKKIRADKLSLRLNIPFKKEMRDLRKLLYASGDQYLFIDDKTKKRNVLGKGSPGTTHTYWSQNQMWKMKTKAGDLPRQIKTKAPALVRKLNKLLDPSYQSKEGFRKNPNALRSVLAFMQFDTSSGTAFPPFHAKFFADKFLPKDSDGIIVDPCAGWGGRLLGSLLVNRKHHVHYYGIDPEIRNKHAYEALKRRVNVWLKKELPGPRDATIFYKPFEDWIKTKKAKSLRNKVDLAITSPPYFVAEQYNTKNKRQSASRYPEYVAWRENFYRKLLQGTFDLLKPNARFVLNIADVSQAPRLERDARKLAAEAGFVSDGFYKLSMAMAPAQRKAGTARHVVSVDGNTFKHEPVFVFRKPFPNEVPPAPKARVRNAAPIIADDLPNLSDWTDPYPAPRLEKVDRFVVVRDDLLKYGSKIRFLDYLISRSPENEFVYGGSNKVGWGAISLAYVCKRYGKKATCFMAKRDRLTWHQKQFKKLGGRIVPVPNGMLNVTMKRARDYAAKQPKRRRLMDIGFDDPTIIACIVKVARGLPIKPKEIWTVASSGTLSRGLQAAFPDAKVFAVQIGHALTKKNVGKAKILKSPYRYDQAVRLEDSPPYPSEQYYDSKLWSFVRKRGSDGALIWNVA
jgi:hypothetical protein